MRARLKLTQTLAQLHILEHMHDLFADYGSTYEDILMDEQSFVESFVEFKVEIDRPPTVEEMEERKENWKRRHPKSRRRKFDDPIYEEHIFSFADVVECASRKRGHRPIKCTCCKED